VTAAGKGIAVRHAVCAGHFWGLAEAADTVRDACWQCPNLAWIAVPVP